MEARDTPNSVLPTASNEIMSLLAAFRMMAATKSPDKEGDNLGAVATRDDCIVAAMSSAKKIESRVVEIIREIGEVVVNTEGTTTDIRGDSVFEYFCEKSILSLLVDIAKEKKQNDSKLTESSCHGVVWSPLVKAQCFQTTSLLLSNVQNNSAVYYVLSNNYINELITCMLPFGQWTDSALSKIMPEYVDLLQNITIQLTRDPHLFPFLTMEDPKTGSTKFPLFSAALELATTSFAQSDSVVYETCLAVVVNLMKNDSAAIQNWIISASVTQKQLAEHLCVRILDRYYRVCDLCTGPVVDFVRSNAIFSQLKGLNDHMGVIQDVFWSGVRGLDVRLCEALLQRVVTILLKNLLPPRNDSQFFDVGVADSDVIPQREARAQVSSLFLAHLFSNLTYRPFQRMLAVAVLHPVSTPLWLSSKSVNFSEDEYVFMPALSDIVNGEEARKEVCPNRFRTELINSLKGDYGDWRFISSACLLQTLLNADSIEIESLAVLNILPEFDGGIYHSSPLEDALSTFLHREHMPSRIAARALECAGYLGIQMVHFAVRICNRDLSLVEKLDFVLKHSKVWESIKQAQIEFCSEATKFTENTGVSDIFLDLIEAAIRKRYPASSTDSKSVVFSCSLSHRGYTEELTDSEVLVRRSRDFAMNDVETARFFINLALHYRALCKAIDHKLRMTLQIDKKHGKLDLVDEADFLTRTIGGLSEKPAAGVEVDLTGRMTFRFNLASSPGKASLKTKTKKSMGSSLILVLDPTDVFVVKQNTGRMEENRSTLICGISLRSVVAAASDGDWLHVAVRHPDVDLLIKNGNMALEFENSGASLVVKQYLDRSREVLRQELLGKVSELLPTGM
eukprot:scaffold834_cov123-Cylindrotheca_fusiformis.AAC.41